MNLFSLVLLIESDNSQDGGQNHSGAMDPSHSLVKPDRTASFSSRHPGRTDGIVSGNEIQVPRQPAESGMPRSVSEGSLVVLEGALGKFCGAGDVLLSCGDADASLLV